jgi:lauroyl/myristoyl acyltransferase
LATPATVPATARGRASYLAYRSLAATLQLLPRPLASMVATASGLTMSEVWRDRRPIVRANMRRVLGPSATDRELDEAVLAAFDSYARYWVESARLSSMLPRDVLKRFSIEGFEPAQQALIERRGAIFALPHLGSWEIGGYWLTLNGHPMTAVVEPLDPPELFEWFKQQRSALGLHVVPLGPGATGELVQALRQGALVGLVADRDLAGTGVEVDFFGERTTLPGGPAVLALRTGAPLFPVAVYQRPGGYYHGVIRPALACERTGRLRDDVESITTDLAREFESLIRTAPTQWHMFQPNWPSDRQP